MNILNNELYKLGLNKLSNNNPSDALKIFQELRNEYSESPILFNEIGVACTQLGHEFVAIQSFERAISIDKTLGIAYYNLGLIYLENQEFNKAINYLNAAIENNSKDIWNCYYSRANTFYTQTATRQMPLALNAISDIEKAIELCPYEDVDFYFIAGLIYKIFENYDKAKFYLIKAANLGDHDANNILSSLK